MTPVGVARTLKSRNRSPEARAAYNAYMREWHRRQGLEYRRKTLYRKYGITVEDFERMLTKQNGGCAACGGPPGGRWNTFHIDHDHDTGVIRGLLCHACNIALGLLGTCPEKLRALAEYADTHTEA